MKVGIRRLAEQAMRDLGDISRQDAIKISALFSKLIIEQIQLGNEIAIPEIGKLVVKTYESRYMYSPVRKVVVHYRKFKAVRFKQFTASRKHAEARGV